MLCCILYGVLGTLRVCQLPVASNRFVCIPFCLSASLSAPSCTLSFSPVHVSHTAVFQFAQKTRMSIAASSISMWLWDWFLACRLSDSLTVWLLVCFSSSPPFSALLHIFAFPSLGSLLLRHKQLTTVPRRDEDLINLRARARVN